MDLNQYRRTRSWKILKLLENAETDKEKKQLDINIDIGAESDEEPYGDSGSSYVPSSNGSSILSDTTVDGSETSVTNFGNKLYEECFPSNPTNADDINLIARHREISEISPLDIDDNPENVPDPTNPDDTNLIAQPEPENFEISASETECTSADGGNILSKSSCTDGIFVKVAKRVGGKRVRDKGHFCLFCDKIMCSNFSRHIENKHSDDTEVAHILAMPKNSKKRRDAFTNLLRCGDFYHNCNVLSTKSGELILTRRPTLIEQNSAYADFGPCPECLGFMMKNHIWHHLKYRCTANQDNTRNRNANDKKSLRGPIAESTALLNGILSTNVSKEFTSNVINKFKSDSISNACKNDQSIMRFGAFLYEKYSITQAELIRQSMRQLGRLVLELKNNGEQFQNLADMLVPEKFDAVVSATKTICFSTTEDPTKRQEFGIPSLALKIGYGIKKCVSIERGQALRKGDLSTNKKCLAFLHLLNLEWSVRISSNALATLLSRKKNATDLLPITTDLLKLSNFLDNEIKKIIRNITPLNYSKLASLTLSRIILFNKRRSGETAKMTLQQYSSRPDWKQSSTEEMKSALTPFENKLASALTIVKIVGKRGRIVPVLLTNDMKQSIDLLILNRVKANILSNNPYIFAISNTELSHIRGHDCLKKWCIEAELQSPELITSTKLRKYVATVCQVFNLTENEYDWLARHLGHDIRVHREFYRLQENTVELTKVSRLLMAVDQGEAHKFSGKQLKDIHIEDFDEIKDNDETIEKNFENDEENQNVKEKDKENSKRKVTTLKNSKKNNSNSKREWTSEQKEIVLKEFSVHIKKGNLPGKQACMEVMDKYAVFGDRKWTDLKFFIKNQLAKLNKMTRK